MKKIILTVAAVFAFGFANAQDKEVSEGFAKGDLYLSGTAGFASSKTGDFKTDGFTLSPGLGYFLTENIALEGQLTYASTKVDNGVVDDKSTGVGAAIGAKYFWTPASKFSLSLGANISYLSTKFDDADVTEKEIGISIPLGLNYFVSNDFALTASWGGFGYSSNDNGGDGAEKTNSFGLAVDMSTINFGLLYKL